MSVQFLFEQNMQRLLPKTAGRILIAYSGGADSSVLLRLAADWGKLNRVSVFAAHMNHMIRGDEADRDEAFCRQTAAGLGVELFVLRQDIPALARRQGRGVEETARDARYDFFLSLMEKHGIPVLLTAHHADDQLETVLFRIARGTGPDGLSGIPEVRAIGTGTERIVIRPLLNVTKKEILDACGRFTPPVTFVTDSTNLSSDCARNLLRHTVIPALEKISGDGVPQQHTVALCEELSQDSQYLSSVVSDTLRDCALPGNRLSLPFVRRLDPSLRTRVIRRFLLQSGVHAEYTHTIAADRLIMSGRTGPLEITLPGHTHLAVVDDCLTIMPDPAPAKPFSLPLEQVMDAKGPVEIPDSSLRLLAGRGQDVPVPDGFRVLTRQTLWNLPDLSGAVFSQPRPGDKLLMLGMHKTVRKLISAAGIRPDIRRSLPVLFIGGEAAWIPFVGTDDRYYKGGADPLTVILTEESFAICGKEAYT